MTVIIRKIGPTIFLSTLLISWAAIMIVRDSAPFRSRYEGDYR
jgi:hypothetical protein